MEDISFAQKITFVIIQAISLLFLFGFANSLASSGVLSMYDTGDQEALVAKKSALIYAFLSIILWLLNWLLG